MAGNPVRYICPICDQELKYGKHFCWNCKSRVEEPWRYTGGHLPNEGHDNCHPAQTYMKPRTGNVQPHTSQNRTYPSSASQSRTYPNNTSQSRNLAGKDNTAKQYTYHRPGQTTKTTSDSYSRPAYENKKKATEKKNTGCASLFIVGFIFYFLIQFLLAIFSFLG